MKKQIKLLKKIDINNLTEINSLVANFEFEIDNNPNEYNFEIYVINSCNKLNINWREKLILELIQATNKMFRSMRITGDYEPILINFNFLSSLFWSPSFGFKIKRSGGKKCFK